MRTQYRLSRACVIGAMIFSLSPLVALAQIGYPREYISPVDGAEMRLLAAGNFSLGSQPEEVRRLVAKLKEPYVGVFQDDLPPRVMSFPNLYIDRYEVTNALYKNYVLKGRGRPSRFGDYAQFNHPRQPVTGITWQDADGYCRWAKKRLPTELEWERAAKGIRNATWPWGNEPEADRFNGRAQRRFAPTFVGSFPRGETPEGVADLAGNVWELTSSRRSDGVHTMKGGSYLNVLSYVRGALRWGTHNETKGAEFLGFRCILDANVTGKRR